jgi:hypothetical protein
VTSGGEVSPRGTVPVQARADAAQRQIRIVSAGLSVGVVALVGVVAFLVTSGAFTPTLSLPAAATWGIAGAGVLALGAGRVVGRRLRRAPAGAGPEAVATRWVNGAVIATALAETPGLLGGLLGLLTGDLLLMAGLAALSVLGILTGSPPRDELERLLRRAPDVGRARG